MPSVKTDDPAMAMAEPKSNPLDHQVMSPNPSTKRTSHETKREIMDAGPMKDINRSRNSSVGSRGRRCRAEPPRTLAMVRITLDDVTRGTTSAVNTLSA